MPPKIVELKLEKGMYADAASQNLTLTDFLAKLEKDKGYVPPKDAKLDAFERQLKAHGIKISGRQVSLVEDFYKTSSSTVLFPEFINKNVRLGMEKVRNECVLDDIVAVTFSIDSGSYNSITGTIDDAETGGRRVGEGAEFPVITITIGEKPIKLVKIGHRVKTSYESIRRMSVNRLAAHFQLVGARLRRNKVAWAIDVLINGDGNSNPAPVFSQSTLNYNGLVDFDFEFEDFEPTVYIATKEGAKAILKLTEFKDPLAGFNYQKTGELVSPMGVTMRRHSSVAADSLIGVDKGSALEMAMETGASLIETERVIDQQFEKAVISEVIGFSKIYTNACRIWDYS